MPTQGEIRAARRQLAELRTADVANGSARCRRCGCTDNFACEGGCAWAEPDLCTACADPDGIGL